MTGGVTATPAKVLLDSAPLLGDESCMDCLSVISVAPSGLWQSRSYPVWYD